MPSILIVDDDPGVRSVLVEILEDLGVEVWAASGLTDARESLAEVSPDAMLVDLMLPDGSGLELLDDIDLSSTRFIIVTGHPDVDTAVRSLRAGVHDFLVKPVDMERVRRLVRSLDTAGALPSPGEPAGNALIGESSAMRTVFDAVERVAPTDATVLLVGESGTGKELVAQAIHEASHRRDGPFLVVNCAALPIPLISSELFGHERGSFPGANRSHRGLFERARGGTLFLDEVTEMPEEIQAHLLRVLETSRIRRLGSAADIECDVRVVAATNKAPEQAVEDGTFREDLYFRLAVFPIRLPLLRERGNDIPLLAEHWLERLNDSARNGARRYFGDGAMRVLERHDWPGNVRELWNVIHRAFILCDEEISSRDLERAISAGGSLAGAPSGMSVGTTIREVERQLIAETLKHYDGNKRTAAKVLGISLKTLYNRLKEYEES